MSSSAHAGAPQAEDARLALLHSLGQLGTPRQLMFDRLVFTAAQVFRVPIALVTLVDRDRVWIKSSVGLAVEEFPRETSFCTRTIATDNVVVIEDAASDPSLRGNPLVSGPPFVRFYAGAPMLARCGLRIGTFCVLDTKSRLVTARQIHSLVVLANSAVRKMEENKPTEFEESLGAVERVEAGALQWQDGVTA